MSKQADLAVNTIHVGGEIICSEEEYRTEVRAALQGFAAKSFDANEDVPAAERAMAEIRRLDEKFGVT